MSDADWDKRAMASSFHIGIDFDTLNFISLNKLSDVVGVKKQENFNVSQRRIFEKDG